LSVYDLETTESFHYTVKAPLVTDLEWMDGHRFIGQSGNQTFITDYDNKNPQLVTPTSYSAGGFFSRDYDQMITFSGNGSYTLQRIDLRAGKDLPADHAQ